MNYKNKKSKSIFIGYKKIFTMDRVDYQSLIIQDIINMHAKEELDTNPWFQRRGVWLNPQKSYLINTLFERKPIPAIYIRHKIELEKGFSIKQIVDGQQRTRAIISYCNNEFTARHPVIGKRVKFSALNPTQKEHFLITPIPVGYLLGASDADVIDIFARINSVSKNLNGQEKRNASWSGEFKQFTIFESVSRTNFWRDYKIFSANDISRMAEVLFISDVTVTLIEGIVNYTVKKIDDYYKKYDEDFPKMNEINERLQRVFDTLVALSPTSIKETIFTERPPIFFSLVIALDSIKKHNIEKIEKGIIEIDNRFNSDVPLQQREPEDIQFHNACSASTSTKENRLVRDAYIKKWIE